jgi:hypothetical protein
MTVISIRVMVALLGLFFVALRHGSTRITTRQTARCARDRGSPVRGQ